MKFSLQFRLWAVCCATVFLFSLNFAGLQTPFCLLTCYFLPIVCLLDARKLHKSCAFFTILTCFFSYLMVSLIHGEVYMSIAVTIAAFPLAYLLGMLVIKSAYNKYDDPLKVFKYMVFSATFGIFLYNVLSYATGMVSTLDVLESRFVRDFWTGELIHPTNFNNRNIFVLCLLFYGVYCSESIIEKVAIIVSNALVLYQSVNTASRTNIVWMLGVYVATYLFWKILNKGARRSKSTRKQKWFGVLTILAVVSLIIYKWDTILLWYKASNLVERARLSSTSAYNFSDDGRLALWAEVISKMGKYPWGNMPTSNYAHNIFLDTYRVTGVIPTCLLMTAMYFIFRNLIVFLKNRTVDRKYKCLAFSIMVGCAGSFMIEPVIEGRPMNLLIFFLIAGMIDELSARIFYTGKIGEFRNESINCE